MENNIKIIRMITGEDVICKVEMFDDYYLITDPMLVIVKMRNGEINILMDNWLPTEIIQNNEVFIHTSKVITEIEPSTSFGSHYVKMVDKVNLSLISKEESKTVDEDVHNMSDVMASIEESQNKTLH